MEALPAFIRELTQKLSRLSFHATSDRRARGRNGQQAACAETKQGKAAAVADLRASDRPSSAAAGAGAEDGRAKKSANSKTGISPTSPAKDVKGMNDAAVVWDSKQASDNVSHDDTTAATTSLSNGSIKHGAQTETKLRYPQSQSPLVTLLQKNREGVLPKGAAYIGAASSTEDSNKMLSEVMDYLEKESASISAITSTHSTHSSSVNGNSHHAVSQSKSRLDSRSQFSNDLDGVPVSSRKQVFETVPRANGDLTKGLRKEGGRPSDKRHPKKIEDYEPGQSSIALLEPSANEDYNPPIVKPGQFCRYTESDTEFEYRIRKKVPMMSQSPSDNSVHDLYRKVQRGGQIPLEGLKYPTVDPETKRAFSVPMPSVPRHHQRLGHTLSDSGAVILTRQQRDQKNALRKLELNRLIAEERRKKMEEERRDIQARRHCDFFMPSQKSPVPLNRYDDSVDERIAPPLAFPSKTKLGSKIRGKARALYNFKAQSERELSFRRGDILYLLRQIDKNWFEGERHGLVGRFPVSYVEVIISLDAAQAVAAESEGLARALYNFIAQSSTELSLKKGDLVKLIRRVDENWFEGRSGNRRGIFPVRYVESLMEPSTPCFTPMSSRTVTPMLGSPATLSPSSSIFSLGPAPSVPSAPLSPVDSELMDDGVEGGSNNWNAELWCSSPNRWAVNAQPAITASRHLHERDYNNPSSTATSTPTRGLYYSTGGLDEPYTPVQPSRPLSRSSSAGPPVDGQLHRENGTDKSKTMGRNGNMAEGFGRDSFARDVQSLTNSYQFENGFDKTSSSSTTWDRRAATTATDVKDRNSSQQTPDGSSKYSHLRYPPYRSQYKYLPRNSDELQLNVGDVIYVVEKCDDGWFVGFSERTKEFGTFPGNYVQRLW